MLATLLSGCQNVKIKDEEFCGIKGELGATCVHTLTPERKKLTKAEWDAQSFGWIAARSSTIADMKVAQEQLCKMCNCCTYEIQKQFKTFWGNLEVASGQKLVSTGEGPFTKMLKPIAKKLARPKVCEKETPQ